MNQDYLFDGDDSDSDPYATDSEADLEEAEKEYLGKDIVDEATQKTMAIPSTILQGIVPVAPSSRSSTPSNVSKSSKGKKRLREQHAHSQSSSRGSSPVPRSSPSPSAAKKVKTTIAVEEIAPQQNDIVSLFRQKSPLSTKDLADAVRKKHWKKDVFTALLKQVARQQGEKQFVLRPEFQK